MAMVRSLAIRLMRLTKIVAVRGFDDLAAALPCKR